TDLSATSSVASITTLPNLSLPAGQLTNFGSPFYTFLSGTTTDALAEGATNLYYTSARDIKFSTTSADYWDGTKSRWATTSSDYWLTTKSTANLSEGSNLYYTDAR